MSAVTLTSLLTSSVIFIIILVIWIAMCCWEAGTKERVQGNATTSLGVVRWTGSNHIILSLACGYLSCAKSKQALFTLTIQVKDNLDEKNVQVIDARGKAR